jgi:hypothetical protein
MSTRDPRKARSRFSAANRRITHGLITQRQRIVDRTARAPRLAGAPSVELIDLRGDLGTDIDYYVYELARLRELAGEIISAFDRPREVVDALDAFETAIPALRSIRNPLTHPSDDDRLDDVAWFDAVLRLRPHGEVQYLVDPRYSHHDAAMKLSEVISTYLAGTASAPPGPEV